MKRYNLAPYMREHTVDHDYMEKSERGAYVLAEDALALYEALRRAVDLYGHPGGPWNVPNDPGGWLHMAREALKKVGG